jgi:hypothetical protein
MPLALALTPHATGGAGADKRAARREAALAPRKQEKPGESAPAP